VTDTDIERFVARMKRERQAAGLPATISDVSTLRLIAAIVSKRRGHGEVIS
jgi:hypothetical protein